MKENTGVLTEKYLICHYETNKIIIKYKKHIKFELKIVQNQKLTKIYLEQIQI